MRRLGRAKIPEHVKSFCAEPGLRLLPVPTVDTGFHEALDHIVGPICRYPYMDPRPWRRRYTQPAQTSWPSAAQPTAEIPVFAPRQRPAQVFRFIIWSLTVDPKANGHAMKSGDDGFQAERRPAISSSLRSLSCWPTALVSMPASLTFGNISSCSSWT